MAFTPWFGTGLETGSVAVFDTVVQAETYTTYVKTGTYSLRTYSGSSITGYARVDVVDHASALVDVGAYVRPDSGSNANRTRVQAYLDDGTYLDIRLNTDFKWDAYVNNVLVASGSQVVAVDTWHNIQVRFYADDAGYIKTRVDGVDDIDYSGDTKPSTSTTFDYVNLFLSTANQDVLWDDITIGTGDWPGDIRYDLLVPDSDDSVEWTPSTGVDNYALVDEVPPSDVDYVSSGSSGEIDRYTLGDWSGGAKTPQFLVAWVRAKKDIAGTRQLSHGLRSGGSEDLAGAYDLTTDFDYYYHLVTDDPDGGGSLDNTVINALKFVLEAA